MTISSLWPILDEAGCGRPVGIDEFQLRGDNPHNSQRNCTQKPSILAVDLSIWICEGITSTALSTFHADPALHLVYQRTTKLLKLGLGLVFVAEGKRRVRVSRDSLVSTSSASLVENSSSNPQKFQPRSGSRFWKASERCVQLLKLLGVPVLQAQAEGEALCALLNERGLVDGIISNDGDCFAFGGRVVYTKFSIENLENRQVIRYDVENLKARKDDKFSAIETNETISLSREDVVALAMLTGSDMMGLGIPSLGGKKAVQFLQVCRSLTHRPGDRTCLDQLLQWGDEVAKAMEIVNETTVQLTENRMCVECDDDGPSTIRTTCCSVCLHSGNKIQHEKHGCEDCGTGPGEGCFIVTPKDKFMRSVREKAMAVRPNFAPRSIVNEYFAPNSNILPNSINSRKESLHIFTVNAKDLFNSTMILKGMSNETSRDYIRETLPQLLARLEVWNRDERNKYIASGQKYKPVPVNIEKRLVKQSLPCFEIKWTIEIGPADGEDGKITFNTMECQSIVARKFPDLVKSFHQEERRREQGRNEIDRRKRFIGEKRKSRRPQERNFLKRTQRSHRHKRHREFNPSRVQKPKEYTMQQSEVSNDIEMLLDNLPSGTVPCGGEKEIFESDYDSEDYEDNEEEDDGFEHFPLESRWSNTSERDDFDCENILSSESQSGNQCVGRDGLSDRLNSHHRNLSGNYGYDFPSYNEYSKGYVQVEIESGGTILLAHSSQNRHVVAHTNNDNNNNNKSLDYYFGDNDENNHCTNKSDNQSGYDRTSPIEGLDHFTDDSRADGEHLYSLHFSENHEVETNCRSTQQQLKYAHQTGASALERDYDNDTHSIQGNYSDSNAMPSLGENERIFCDFGIQIEVTPIAPRRRRRTISGRHNVMPVEYKEDNNLQFNRVGS
mmetsp:Transcript_5774/g.12667  ORF Transcript_5774/g.12667 Transcript_5774/m.12667 type:complete len:896 (+) Transcript_5774:113-2800(+)